MTKGYSLSIFPTSWNMGMYKIRNKKLWAIGPFRFSIHNIINKKLSDY